MQIHAFAHSSKLRMLSCVPEIVYQSDFELCTAVFVLTSRVTAAGIMHFGRLCSALLRVPVNILT